MSYLMISPISLYISTKNKKLLFEVAYIEKWLFPEMRVTTFLFYPIFV